MVADIFFNEYGTSKVVGYKLYCMHIVESTAVLVSF